MESFTTSAPRKNSTVRLVFSCLIGIVVGLLVWFAWTHPNPSPPDLYQPWLGARLMLEGGDPYRLVGPSRAYPHEFLFLYPLVASIIVLPLTAFAISVATGIFAGLSAGLFAYFAGYERWPMFLSFPFVLAAWTGQWAVLFSVVFLVPSLSFLYAAKPSIGLALFVARWDAPRFAVIGGLILLSLSALIAPHWPAEWVSNVMRGTGHMIIPGLKPGGIIALMALLRWRRPEARLIAFLAMVPQTGFWYEAVPLFLVPETFRQSMVLAITTSAPVIYEILFASQRGVAELWPRTTRLHCSPICLVW